MISRINYRICQVLVVAVLIALPLMAAVAQQEKTVTITTSDPAPTTFLQLFEQADLVAIIKIQSGDAENYKYTIYKAVVTEVFKGTSGESTIYFGPFIGYAVGGEYLVFLKKTPQKITELVLEANNSEAIPYKSQQSYYQIMYDGYSVMPINYVCVFDGKEIHDRCDYGVKFNIEQVNLPNKIKVFPTDLDEGSSIASKWVRKNEIVKLLRSLQSSKPKKNN
jgi:hypothetical protein